MTSMSDLAGQSLTWVPSRKFWELIASDNSVIATFPVEKSTTRLVGIAGTRWEKAKALIPDGTGALFLNAEGRDVKVRILLSKAHVLPSIKSPGWCFLMDAGFCGFVSAFP